jgi:hypothetical protein
VKNRQKKSKGGLKVKSQVKAGGFSPQHNRALAKA